jgi:DNA-binding response OmpR family regulator
MAYETILVVDDETNIRELARLYLEEAGYGVVVAEDGRQALDQVKQSRPDLVVLDLMLPLLDGLEVCRRIRAESRLPIIMLTARDEDIDKIVGLELGADDYVTKPFNPRELVARVRAVLRRGEPAAPAPTRKRRAGNVTLDPAGREVTVAGETVSLRAKEFDLLLAFVDHPHIVLSRDQLLDLVWGYEYYGRTRTVDVHVANLRERIRASDLVIETVWGKGYKLVLP